MFVHSYVDEVFLGCLKYFGRQRSPFEINQTIQMLIVLFHWQFPLEFIKQASLIIENTEVHFGLQPRRDECTAGSIKTFQVGWRSSISCNKKQIFVEFGIYWFSYEEFGMEFKMNFFISQTQWWMLVCSQQAITFALKFEYTSKQFWTFELRFTCGITSLPRLHINVAIENN